MLTAALSASCLRAQAGGVGTTAANFLKIPVGTKQIAMGDQGVALPIDASSLNHNPANLNALNYKQFSFEHNKWAEGVNQDYAAYAHPNLSIGSVGASLNLFRVGSFQGYDNAGGNAGDVTAQDMAATFGYARHVWGLSDPDDGAGLAAGVSATAIKETLDNESASAFAGDVGALYHFNYKGALMHAGAAVRNMGQGLSYYGSAAPLPRTYAAGLSASTFLRGDPTTLSVEVRKPIDNSVSFSLGGEYWVNSLLGVRAGFVNSDDLGPGIRAGVGIKVKIVEFDYALSILGGFGITHRVGLTVRLGAPVDRTPGELTPNAKAAGKAVRRARRLLAENRYLDSMLEINKALQLDANSPEALELLDKVQAQMKDIETPKVEAPKIETPASEAPKTEAPKTP